MSITTEESKPREENLERARALVAAGIFGGGEWIDEGETSVANTSIISRDIAHALDEAEKRGRESVCIETATATGLQIAIEREREACASVVDDISVMNHGAVDGLGWELASVYNLLSRIAAAIRARGKS